MKLEKSKSDILLNRISLATLVLAAVVLLSLGIFSAAVKAEAWDGTFGTAFASGSGTSSDPYIINTEAQYAYFIQSTVDGATYEGKYISLNNSMDMTAASFKVGGSFGGTFNGNGYEILSAYPMFSTISSTGTVNYLRYTACGTFSNAIICASNYGTVSNVNVYGNIVFFKTTSYPGHICNYCYGTINNCSSVGDIYAYARTTGSGSDKEDCETYIGMAGRLSGTIRNCYYKGTITGTNVTSTGIAGFVQEDDDATVVNCYFNQAVTASALNTYSISGYTWYSVGEVNDTNPIVRKTDTTGYSTHCVLIDDSYSFDTFTLTSTSTSDTIYYTIDGSNPASSSTRKTATRDAAIQISGNFTVKAVTYCSGKYGVSSEKSILKSGVLGELAWILKGTGILEISGSGAMKDIYASNAPWQNYINRITTVEIDSGVTSIGSCAFDGCSNLASIEIPSSVTSIGTCAFDGCSSLTSIEIPSSVTSIGESAFCGCSSLESMTLPGYDRFTLGYIFGTSYSGVYQKYDSGYGYYSIPSSLKNINIIAGKINPYFFQNCRNLTSVKISEGVTSIGASAFSGCSGLESITIPFVGSSASSTLPFGYIFGTYNYTGAQYVEQNSSTYYMPSSLKSVTVTGGEINSYAFQNCSSLKSINIPSSVTEIGSYAFSGCSSITSIKIPSGVTSINEGMFYNCTNLTSIEIPSSVTDIGKSSFFGCSSLSRINIPIGATDIGENAFQGCANLLNVSVPETVESIGTNAFYNCNNVTTVNIITSKGYTHTQDFHNGDESEWSHINFANAQANPLQSGKACLYLNGEKLNYFSVTGDAEIGSEEYNQDVSDYAFYRCQNEMSVTANGEYQGSIGNYAFYQSNINYLGFPISTKSIGDYALYGCEKLTECYQNVFRCESIGQYAFSGTGISYVNIDSYSRLTSIGACAFENCKSLTAITFKCNQPTIGGGAFNGVTADVTCICNGGYDTTKNYGGTLTWNIEHTQVSDTGYAATCTEAGLTDGSHCSACGEVLVAQEVIPALGHDIVTTTVAPTCQAAGYDKHQCSRCEYNYIDNETAKLTHKWQTNVVAPTCTEEGYTYRECSLCGTTTPHTAKTAALGHSFTVYVSNNDATCILDGTKTACCDNECGTTDTITDEGSAHGHTYGAWIDNGNGTHTRTCMDCSNAETESHHNVETARDNETCTQTGLITYTCSDCEAVTTEEIPVHNHTLEVWASDGSGTGTHHSVCQECGQTFTENCTFTETVVAPTCQNQGYTIHVCSGCGYAYKTNITAKTGHSFQHLEYKAPSCTEDGNEDCYICTSCKTYFWADNDELYCDASDVILPATGHTEVIDEATGKTVCSECGEVISGATIHHLTYLEPVAATCTTDGHIGYWMCDDEDCGYMFSDEEGTIRVYADDVVLKADGVSHVMNAGTVTASASCTETGEMTYTCTLCGEQTTEEISAKGHTVVEITALAPTCTKEGHTAGSYCSACNETLEESTAIPALGGNHQYENGVCTICGAEQVLVSVTSSAGTSESVAKLYGGGRYAEGEIVTVTATMVNGFAFVGWYNGDEQLAADYEYSFTASENISLVARYRSAAMVKLTVTGEKFAVNGVKQSGTYISSLPAGSKVTVSFYGAAENFLRWKGKSGLTESTDAVYEFTLAGEKYLESTAKPEVEQDSAYVEFVALSGQIISCGTWTANDKVYNHVLPTGPSHTGSIFHCWGIDGVEMDVKGIIDYIASHDDAYITVTPIYVSSDKEYTVTLDINGTEETAKVKDAETYAAAAPEIEGRQFVCWKNSAGEILSYSSNFQVQVLSDMKLIAVYQDAGGMVEAEPTIVITNLTTETVDTVNKIKWSITRDVPEKYTVVEHGIIRTKIPETGTVEKLVFNTDGSCPADCNSMSDTTLTNKGTYTYSLKVSDTSRVYYLRGYMILQDNEGNLSYYYTPISQTSFDSIGN